MYNLNNRVYYFNFEAQQGPSDKLRTLEEIFSNIKTQTPNKIVEVIKIDSINDCKKTYYRLEGIRGLTFLDRDIFRSRSDMLRQLLILIADEVKRMNDLVIEIEKEM